MHTVEAFLAVADATGNETYRWRAGRIIDHVLTWANHNDWRIPEHFEKTGHRIWTVTRIIRTIRSNPMVQHRVMVSNGQD